MFVTIKKHLTNHRGVLAMPRFILIAIAFVVGSICLTMVTSAVQGPTNRWHNDVVHQWWNDGGISINVPGDSGDTDTDTETDDDTDDIITDLNGGFPNINTPEVTTPSNTNALIWNSQEDYSDAAAMILWAPRQNYNGLPCAYKIAEYTKDIDEMEFTINCNTDDVYTGYTKVDEYFTLINIIVNGELYQFVTCSTSDYTGSYNNQTFYLPEPGLYACAGRNYQDDIIEPHEQDITFTWK